MQEQEKVVAMERKGPGYANGRAGIVVPMEDGDSRFVQASFMREQITERMQNIAKENAKLKERIAAIDAERGQLALTSQQQMGGYEALRALLDTLPED